MEEVPETLVLEIPMTQPSAKASRAEKPLSSDEPKSNQNNDRSDADFEAAYAADTESEAQSTGQNTPDGDTSGDDVQTANKVTVPEGEEPDATATFNAATTADDELTITSKTSETDAAIHAEKAVRKPVSDAGELVFAQRVRAGQSADSTTGSAQTGKQPGADALANAADEGVRVKVPASAQSKAPDGTGAAQSVGATSEGISDKAPPSQTNASSGTAKAAEFAIAAAKRTDIEPPAPNTDKREAGKTDRDRAPRENATQPSVTVKAATPAAPTPAQPASAHTAMPLTVQGDASGLDVAISATSDLDAPSSWDPRGAAPATLAQTLSRPETPGMIGRQMAEILQRFPDRPVELSLNPEELGRVRLNISAAEGGITVHVLAERPETLDLMRRHIDQLGREFQALGYENINFAFNEGQSDQGAGQNQDGASSAASGIEPGESKAEPAIPVTLAASTGVDLRL